MLGDACSREASAAISSLTSHRLSDDLTNGQADEWSGCRRAHPAVTSMSHSRRGAYRGHVSETCARISLACRAHRLHLSGSLPSSWLSSRRGVLGRFSRCSRCACAVAPSRSSHWLRLHSQAGVLPQYKRTGHPQNYVGDERLDRNGSGLTCHGMDSAPLVNAASPMVACGRGRRKWEGPGGIAGHR